jgi:hypothetical protein
MALQAIPALGYIGFDAVLIQVERDFLPGCQQAFCPGKPRLQHWQQGNIVARVISFGINSFGI